MKFSKEDIELIEKFIDIKNRGYYADGKQLTEVYNRVLERNVPTTNCGSCLRQRVNELETALNHFKSLQDRSKDVDPTPVKEEENNEPTAKKVGRPKKK